jgi:hypothetical protein
MLGCFISSNLVVEALAKARAFLIQRNLMNEQFEGALNSVDVPPTDNLPETETLETTSPTETFPGADAQDNGGAQWSLNEAPGDTGQERRPVPYERFREVNEKAQRAVEYEQQIGEYREAAELGIPLAQYRQIAADAAQHGFSDVASYLEAAQQQQRLQQEQQRIEAEMQKTQARQDLSETYRNQLLAVQNQALVTARQQAELQQQYLATNRQLALREHLDRRSVMVAAREAIPKMTPKLEKLLNATATHLIPEVIAEFQASFAATAPDVEKLKQEAIAEYASKKAADAAIASPEGRGGSAPPLYTNKEAWKQSFASLLFGRREN